MSALSVARAASRGRAVLDSVASRVARGSERRWLSMLAQTDAETVDVAVLGAGISGLSTAQALSVPAPDRAPSMVVLEASDRVGGAIRSVSRDGYAWEEGPNTVISNKWIVRAAEDAGVVDRLLLAKSKAPRWIFWDGQLRSIRAGFSGSDALFTPGELFRAWARVLGVRPSPPEGVEETVASFFERNMGHDVLERLARPFCGGVYASEADDLSVKAAFPALYKFESTGGSVAGGVALTIAKGIARRLSSPAGPRPKSRGHGRISSFEGGLSTLPKAMAARLGESVHLDAPVLSIAREGALYRLRYGGSVPREVLVRSVVSTLPTAAIATLLEDVVPKAADALRRVRYAPLAVGVLSYPSEDLVDARTDDDGVLVGFGQLHPRSQGLGTLGILYGSSLFEGRAPRGRNVVLAFIGGTPSPAKVTLPDAELVAMAHGDLVRSGVVKEGASQPELLGLRRWEAAIPVYQVGHLDTVQEAKDALMEAGWDRFVLSGNFTSGVALGSCIEYAYETVAPQVERLLA